MRKAKNKLRNRQITAKTKLIFQSPCRCAGGFRHCGSLRIYDWGEDQIMFVHRKSNIAWGKGAKKYNNIGIVVDRNRLLKSLRKSKKNSRVRPTFS